MNRKYFNDQIHACRIEYAKGSSQNWIYGMYNIFFFTFLILIKVKITTTILDPEQETNNYLII